VAWTAITPHTVANGDDFSVASNWNTWITAQFTNLNLANGSWTSYTPTLTGSTTNPTNYTGSGAYCSLGNVILFQYRIDTGASWTVGSGTYSISLPVNADTTYSAAGGSGRVRLSAGLVPILPLLASSTTLRLDYLTSLTGGMATWGSASATPVSITQAAIGLLIYAAA
jgi:hypothetical protein